MTLPETLDSVLVRTIVEARYEGVFNVLDKARSGAGLPDMYDEDVPSTSFLFDGGLHKMKGQAFLPPSSIRMLRTR